MHTGSFPTTATPATLTTLSADFQLIDHEVGERCEVQNQ